MGDLGSEGNTGLRLTSGFYLFPSLPPPPLRGSSHSPCPHESHPFPEPASPSLPPQCPSSPAPNPSPKPPPPPSHGRQTLLGGGPPTPEAAVLQVWLLEGEGGQGSAGKGRSQGTRLGSGCRIWDLTADTFPQDLPTPDWQL